MEETKKIKFGLVGCGRVSKKHFESITSNKNALLVATCDIDIHKAVECKNKYNAKYAFKEYLDMLANQEIDVVNICTPSGIHAEMGLLAAKYGKHCIIEKPMALNTKDAIKLIKAFKRKKLSLQVVLQNRFNHVIKYLKNIIDNNELGDIFIANATARWYRDQSYYEDGWHGTEENDGGALMNQGTHYVDILLYLVNKPIKSIYCSKSTLNHKMECEDVAALTVTFKDNSIGIIEVSTLAYPKNLEGSITLVCKKGSIKIGGTSLNKVEYCTLKELSLEEDHSSVYGNGHKTIIDNMIHHLLNNEPLHVDGNEGIKSLELIQAAYKSAKTGKSVNL